MPTIEENAARIGTNEGGLVAVEARVTTNEGAIANHEGRITTLEAVVPAPDLSTEVAANAAAITTLQGLPHQDNTAELADHAGRITVNEDESQSQDIRIEALENAPAPTPLFSGAKLTASAFSQNASQGQTKTLVWDAEVYDDGGWADLGVNDDRFIVPAGVTRISATGNISFHNLGISTQVHAKILHNDVVVADQRNTTDQLEAPAFNVSSGVIAVSPGDTIKLAFQQNNEPTTISASADLTSFSIVKV